MADITKVLSVVRESLIAEDIKPVQVFSVVRESLVGDGYGYNAIAYTYSVVRESLIKEAPVAVFSVTREALVSRPAEDATQAYLVPQFQQTVLMVRPTMPDPSTVRSITEIASYRQAVVIGRGITPPFSDISAAGMRAQVVLDRVVLPAPQVFSLLSAGTLRMLIVQSRNRQYEPISMVYAAQLRSMVVAHRDTTPAGEIRTPITVKGHVQQIIQSRVHGEVVIQTYAYVPQLSMMVVQQDTRPAPISTMEARTLRMLVVREHIMPPPGIDDRVAQTMQQVVQAREITPPHGEDQVAQLRQLTVVENTRPAQISMTTLRSMRMLTVMRKDTYPPQFALGRQTAALQQQVVQERPLTANQHSVTSAGSLRIAFVLEKIVPRPIDVIDPSVGRHVFSQVMLAVQHRDTEPPEQISTYSRFVFSLAGQVVVGDKFPLPPYPEPTEETLLTSVLQQAVIRDPDDWAPVSALTVRQAVGSLVIGDAEGWVDATLPQSEAELAGITQSVAVGDAFPDPFVPLSDAVVGVLGEVIVVGDSTMPDPMLPLSEIAARQVAEFAALGDAEWPDPAVPLSDASVKRLTSFLAVHDPSLTGEFGGSDVSTLSVVEIYVVRDPTLKGIPLRQGPRPVVSVTIS